MTIGFVGLGTMGGPMYRNLAARQAEPVLAFDRDPALGNAAFADVAGADTIFLALPSGAHVESVCEDLLPSARPGQAVVDLGTSPVALTRTLAARFADRGSAYADAPIARTRQAAIDGTLSIMVGADADTFARLRPLLACMATDITHCGPAGSGQLAKIMVLIQTVVALAEALAVARGAGMDGQALLETLSRGSADSFALRNHGLRAMVPGAYPERAFSTEYARKDLGYALDLASELGLELRGAELADTVLADAIEAGFGANYWPVLARVIDRQRGSLVPMPPATAAS